MNRTQAIKEIIRLKEKKKNDGYYEAWGTQDIIDYLKEHFKIMEEDINE